MTVAPRIDLSAAALAYVRDFDWYVFPVGPDKKPLTPHGFKDATQDAGQIRQWWSRWPSANIGVACGASGLVVIDIDVKDNAPGLENWAKLTADREPIETAMARTPSGGFHCFFLAPDLVDIRNSAGKIAPGIDVRADGGYVIVPPSETDVGSYEWIQP